MTTNITTDRAQPTAQAKVRPGLRGMLASRLAREPRTYRDPRLAARRAAMVGEACPAPTEVRPFSDLAVPVDELTL